MLFKYLFTFLFFTILSTIIFAQDNTPKVMTQEERLKKIEAKLDELSKSSTPGLKEVVDFSVSGVSIQEFLRGLAETNNLNISIDPTLNIKVVNNFTNEKVASILLFLCKEYSLDIHNTGILSLKIDKPLFLTDNFEKPILSTEPFFSNSVYKIELYEKYKHLFEI